MTEIVDKKSLLAIERIMTICNELHILTTGKDAEYFYDRLEMNILIDLVLEVDSCVREVSDSLKKKYLEVDWNIVDKARYVDEVFGYSMKVSKAWELASCLDTVFLNKLQDILEKELESYYHEICLRRQEELRNE